MGNEQSDQSGENLDYNDPSEEGPGPSYGSKLTAAAAVSAGGIRAPTARVLSNYQQNQSSNTNTNSNNFNKNQQVSNSLSIGTNQNLSKTASLQQTAYIENAHTGYIRCIAFYQPSYQGENLQQNQFSFLISGAQDGHIRFWAVQQQNSKHRNCQRVLWPGLITGRSVTSLLIIDDFLISGHADGSLLLWDLNTITQCAQLYGQSVSDPQLLFSQVLLCAIDGYHSRAVYALTAYQTGKDWILVSGAEQLILWRLLVDSQEETGACTPGAALEAVYSLAQETQCVLYIGDRIRTGDQNDSNLNQPWVCEWGDFGRIITGDSQGMIKCFFAENGIFYQEKSQSGHKQGVWSLIVGHSSGTSIYPLLFSGSADGTIRMWGLPSFQPLLIIPVGSLIGGLSFEFSQNVSKVARLISVSHDGGLRLWRVEQGQNHNVNNRDSNFDRNVTHQTFYSEGHHYSEAPRAKDSPLDQQESDGPIGHIGTGPGPVPVIGQSNNVKNIIQNKNNKNQCNVKKMIRRPFPGRGEPESVPLGFNKDYDPLAAPPVKIETAIKKEIFQSSDSEAQAKAQGNGNAQESGFSISTARNLSKVAYKKEAEGIQIFGGALIQTNQSLSSPSSVASLSQQNLGPLNLGSQQNLGSSSVLGSQQNLDPQYVASQQNLNPVNLSSQKNLVSGTLSPQNLIALEGMITNSQRDLAQQTQNDEVQNYTTKTNQDDATVVLSQKNIDPMIVNSQTQNNIDIDTDQQQLQQQVTSDTEIDQKNDNLQSISNIIQLQQVTMPMSVPSPDIPSMKDDPILRRLTSSGPEGIKIPESSKKILEMNREQNIENRNIRVPNTNSNIDTVTGNYGLSNESKPVVSNADGSGHNQSINTNYNNNQIHNVNVNSDSIKSQLSDKPSLELESEIQFEQQLYCCIFTSSNSIACGGAKGSLRLVGMEFDKKPIKSLASNFAPTTVTVPGAGGFQVNPNTVNRNFNNDSTFVVPQMQYDPNIDYSKYTGMGQNQNQGQTAKIDLTLREPISLK